MATPKWQLQSPINAIIFDCDGTLSSIEGIDELAKLHGVGEEVKAITADAMGKSGINPELYQQRLDLVQPKQEEVVALGQQYLTHCEPDTFKIIELLKNLNKTVYIISAGLLPAVTFFGEILQVPHENIFAVNIYFDSDGNYLDFDHTSSLIDRNGKRLIVSELKIRHPEMIYVGDGLNDLAVQDLTTRFIGYGGVYYRSNIAELCDFYIKTESLAAVLPLSLTQDEYEKLAKSEQDLYQQGLRAIEEGQVFIK